MMLLAIWPGLAGAVGLGGIVGLLSGWPESRAVPLGLVGGALALALLAVLRIVPGQPGLWLELAAMMLPLYLAGCALGALGNRRVGAGR